MASAKIVLLLTGLSAAFAHYGIFSYDDKAKNSLSENYLYPFQRLGNNYYYIEDERKVNWFQAQQECRTHGAFLANIKSAEEIQIIEEYLFAKNHTKEYTKFWIDGNDLGERDLYMSLATGQPMPYQQWVYGNPSHGYGTEFCVQLWLRAGKYGMNDDTCIATGHFICQLINPRTIGVTVW